MSSAGATTLKNPFVVLSIDGAKCKKIFLLDLAVWGKEQKENEYILGHGSQKVNFGHFLNLRDKGIPNGYSKPSRNDIRIPKSEVYFFIAIAILSSSKLKLARIGHFRTDDGIAFVFFCYEAEPQQEGALQSRSS